ncbi:MAG: hypothetical protein JSW51_06295 [Gemmatimonadota bacterium]|nr:MAG: hypothetical protein JSW51_06295 [Gemmatimonadota bacterium]
MNRLTPYDFAIGEEIEQRFVGIMEETRLSKKDASDPAQFMSLSLVQRTLSDMEAQQTLADHPEAAAEYLLLLFAAFQFWRGGKVVYHVDREGWDDRTFDSFAELHAEPIACYLQLSERWFWAQIEEGAPHEPLDGIFLAPSADGTRLTLVAILGMRSERHGFSQISITVGRDELTSAHAEARHPLFEPVMEGGHHAGFKSICSAADLLVLTQLALAQVTR